jgi:hypothetical protein
VGSGSHTLVVSMLRADRVKIVNTHHGGTGVTRVGLVMLVDCLHMNVF